MGVAFITLLSHKKPFFAPSASGHEGAKKGAKRTFSSVYGTGLVTILRRPPYLHSLINT